MLKVESNKIIGSQYLRPVITLINIWMLCLSLVSLTDAVLNHDGIGWLSQTMYSIFVLLISIEVVVLLVFLNTIGRKKVVELSVQEGLKVCTKNLFWGFEVNMILPFSSIVSFEYEDVIDIDVAVSVESQKSAELRHLFVGWSQTEATQFCFAANQMISNI